MTNPDGSRKGAYQKAIEAIIPIARTPEPGRPPTAKIDVHGSDTVNDLRETVRRDSGKIGDKEAGKRVLDAQQKASLFATLEGRIVSDPKRYKDIDFVAVKNALDAADESLLYGLLKMEENGHEVGITREKRDGINGFRFDSCSASSPIGVRDVDYPRAEEIAEKEWGVPLMPKEVFKELKAAGIITEKGTWSHLKADAKRLKDADMSWCGYDYGAHEHRAESHRRDGGFRCSLWVAEAR